ncbi:hypothetical protein OsJ_10869 [Oryza sativa Japonica Group]|uniref:Uncharacterized protein n=1 Tax=Oryza sativa subsp. japonica TaxID=39947 RepID=A3AI03_ORYSJ|nr:hypothetical protein OsJ_10869 [Oryza sativa Japonica Group]
MVAMLALLSTGLSLSLSRADLAAVVVAEPRLLCAKADTIAASARLGASTDKHVDERERDAGVLHGAAHPGAQLGPHRRRGGRGWPESVGARALVRHRGAQSRLRVADAPKHLGPGHGPLDAVQPPRRARRKGRPPTQGPWRSRRARPPGNPVFPVVNGNGIRPAEAVDGAGG